MIQRTNFRIYPLLIITLFLIIASSCKKDNNDPIPYNPTNSNATNGKTKAVFNTDVTYGTLTDQDGNVYKTVTIGTQTWMAENLRTTKYNDGTTIPNVTDDGEWGNISTGAYCNYNNTANTDTIATYGRLYNWYAVNTGKLAPKGWHVATNVEWTKLTTNLYGESIPGGKLKEAGTTHWSISYTYANETGFTALPGGARGYEGIFGSIGNSGYWWSATDFSAILAITYYVLPINNVYDGNYPKEAGFSVRCVRD